MESQEGMIYIFTTSMFIIIAVSSKPLIGHTHQPAASSERAWTLEEMCGVMEYVV